MNVLLRRALLSVVIVAALAAGPTAITWAEEALQPVCPICENLRKEHLRYSDKTANTLGRGLLNFTLGWTELIRQPAKKAREDKDVWRGIANGIGKSAVRSVRGLGEILTFWTPETKDGYIHFSKDCPIDTMN